ncbi:MAG: radical SAM family heme chaperone HemW [Elusimicrobia bacterium]|nr:radical SAM family heme chaperone HemW [Elusimicrobiota bacterium]
MRSAGPGLYVHIPFCSKKCLYCGSVSFSGRQAEAGRYLRALEREASCRPAFKPATLYVGGGTPSELSCEQMGSLLASLSERFGSLEALREATLEGNPESLDAPKLDVLRRAGVRRLSIGLQTTEDRLLKAIGRRHSFADFERVYQEARGRSFSLSVDLMLGLPGQSLSGALASLKAVLRLDPGHLSLYCLHVEEGTPFAAEGLAVDEDLSREMLEASIELLAKAGYRHYEISNFAKPGRESLHNLNYWENGPYLGLGCAAAGCLGGVRYRNEGELHAYCAKIERGESAAVSSEALAGKEKTGEDLMLGLRLIEGIRLTRPMRRYFASELESLRRRGLIELERSPKTGLPLRARLSRRGLFFANEVFREFVPPYMESSHMRPKHQALPKGTQCGAAAAAPEACT